MKKHIKLFFIFILSLSVINISTVQAATLDEIKERGEIVVGMNAEYPPFEWVEIVDGEPQYVGIDVALAQLIADEIGVKLVIDNRSFDSLIPSLQTNKMDMIISGMDSTPERAEQVDFSVPYFKETSQFAVESGQAEQYHAIEDFNAKRVGVLKGSSQEIYLRENMPEIELVSIAKNGDLLEALQGKKVDAIFMSDLSLAQYLVNYGDTVELVEDIEEENEGMGSSVALTKDNTELLEVVDSVITEAIETGRMDEFITEYTELASEKTTVE